MKRKLQPITVICALALCFLLPAAQGRAAVNIGTANMGTDPTSPDNDFIKDSGTLTINSTKLAVIEKAFLDDNDGTEVTSGSTVVKGTIIKFVIYIDNTTTSQASDVRLVDLLDEVAFTYQAGSLKWNNNTTTSAAPPATIFNDTNYGVSLTDAISSTDVGSADTTQTPNDRITFGAVTDQANATMNIPAGKIAAFMFRARAN
jgi:hypothetical protein